MLVRSCWQSWKPSNHVVGSSCSIQARRHTCRPHALLASRTPVRHRHTETSNLSSKEAIARATELAESPLERYPRFQPDGTYGKSETHLGESTEEKRVRVSDGELELYGRIISIRKASRNLRFFDIETSSGTQQVIVDYRAVRDEGPYFGEEAFLHRTNMLNRGDHIYVSGNKVGPQSDGRHALKATRLPVVMSPCLHRFPVRKGKDETPPEHSELDRHEEMMTYPSIIETLKVRNLFLRAMREFFHTQRFTEVQTPILAGLAGGANARPFETSATEFANRRISLRIAPELWLKRLIVGGMSNIYEIGPSFRNEGLDKTHNPEFTTCEFYAPYWGLRKLQTTTIDLLIFAWEFSNELAPNAGKTFIPAKAEEVDFIPALNKHLGLDLPTLDISNQDTILSVLQKHNIPIPSTPSLPNLLDKLSTHFLEPLCKEPTWIINMPDCMSPLSKSFIHPTAPNNQRVSARAELFVQSKEVVNCYEEENSPFEQRRKFVEQQIYASNPAGTNLPSTITDLQQYIDSNDKARLSELGVDPSKIDEDYLRALEWGLPPTGGWGCGIDRLIMLFMGKERISDVLSFGNLRAVSKNAERRSKSKSKSKSGGNGQVRKGESG